MTRSSIPVSKAFRDELRDRKRDGESYEAYLRRQLEGDSADIAAVLARLDDLETSIPTKTADELATQFR